MRDPEAAEKRARHSKKEKELPDKETLDITTYQALFVERGRVYLVYYYSQ
jgi:hypothetical protein